MVSLELAHCGEVSALPSFFVIPTKLVTCIIHWINPYVFFSEA